MRRSLPTFLCAVLGTSLAACDPETSSDPLNDDELALFDFDFRSGATPAIPGYPGDGDITVRRGTSNNNNGGGGDLDLFDFVNNVVVSRTGLQTVRITEAGVETPGGALLCSLVEENGFTVLRNANNTALYSSAGPWVFAGKPNLAGLSDDEQFSVLQAALLMSFEDEEMVDGFPTTGLAVAEATAELELATPRRKLAIAAMVDGICGGEDLANDGL